MLRKPKYHICVILLIMSLFTIFILKTSNFLECLALGDMAQAMEEESSQESVFPDDIRLLSNINLQSINEGDLQGKDTLSYLTPKRATKVQENRTSPKKKEIVSKALQETAKQTVKTQGEDANNPVNNITDSSNDSEKATDLPKKSDNSETVKRNTSTKKVDTTSKSAETQPPKVKTQEQAQKPESKPTDTPKEGTEAKEADADASIGEDNSQTANIIDTSKVSVGAIGIRYKNQNGKRLKLMVEKSGGRYTYDLKGDNSLEQFPLQMGNGQYTISVMENISGNSYKYIQSDTINVNIANPNNVYLLSFSKVNWSTGMKAATKAKELTAGVGSNEEKVKKIYDYITSNFTFNNKKLDNISSSYLPNIDSVLANKSGICYDFASLTAGMLRGIGIPTKLIMGYADGVNGYHAWNEVLIGGTWRIIDTSTDTQLKNNNPAMYKNSSSYRVEKVY